MKTIRILLTDATTGTWATEHSELITTGIRISEDRDYWQLVEAIEPAITRWLKTFPPTAATRAILDDGMLVLIDPNGTDLGGQPIEGGEVVCQFRLFEGGVEPLV